MVTGIIRDPTQNETQGQEGFIPLQTSKGLTKTPEDKLYGRLAEEQQKANKQKLPFAWAAAKAKVEDIQRQAKEQLKRRGHLKDYKVPEIDFKEFSDVKNFELVDEGERYDEQLSKVHHMPVYIAYKTYVFNGFEQYTYRICESLEEALDRARKKHLPPTVQLVEKIEKKK